MKAIAEKYKNKPSYATIRRWVKEERERVANNKPPLTPKRKKRGRPPVFTRKEVEKMQDFIQANKHKVCFFLAKCLCRQKQIPLMEVRVT